MHNNIEKLFATGLFNIKPGLERINKVLSLFNSPHKNRKYVIVGGTNGKGSVCTYLSKILENNDYKTGLYTSPHLISVTERIKVNGKDISEQDLDGLLNHIFNICEENNIELSYFELITTAAFIYFDQNKVDIGILEVGMGGRWDATNVITPLISVITNVSLDHTKYLGNTVKEIAIEKAEIIKKNGIVVTAAENEALEVIKQKSREVSAEVHIIDTKTITKSSDLKSTGKYQDKNIELSIYCSELLNNNFKFIIDSNRLQQAVKDTNFEGRFEIVRENPPLIIDGGHNVEAAKNLVDSLLNIYPDKKFDFLISMLNTKDINGFLKEIKKISSKLIITEIPDKLSYTADEIEKFVKKHKFPEYEVIKKPQDAFNQLKSYNSPSCVCGSFYLIGYLKKEVLNEKTGAGKT